MGFFDKIKEVTSQISLSSDSSSSYKTEEQSFNKVQTQTPPPAPMPVSTPPAQSSSAGLYDPALERLIEMAIADGELTDKERAVLFKRAEAMGVDLDEFEMVLEARLYEKGQQMAAQTAAAPAPTSNKHGGIKKCPACGAVVPPFTAKCVDCGFEFNDAQANSNVERLFAMLNELEAQSQEDATGLFGGMSQAMGASFSSMMGGDKVTRRKKTLIENFPIPTTKDDILEFLTLAAPRTKTSMFNSDTNAKEMAKAWKSKCEQIIMKAKIVLRDDKQTLEIIQEYAKELKIKY